jgi:hypothetical protein
MADLMADFHGAIEVAGAPVLEECVPELRTDFPIASERIDVGDRNATLKVTGDVLKILGRLAINVARQIEVEVVILDLGEGDHARVFRNIDLLVERVHDSVDVHRA